MCVLHVIVKLGGLIIVFIAFVAVLHDVCQFLLRVLLRQTQTFSRKFLLLFVPLVTHDDILFQMLLILCLLG